MRQSCRFVPLCSNRGGKTFPKDDVLRKKWIVAIRRRDESYRGKLWSPSASSPFCHKHFTEDVFIKTHQSSSSRFSNDRENSSPRGCTLLRQAEPGDAIMADKGFNVQDLLETSNVVINIPTFSKRKNRMINATVMRDRRISSKRVHVERIIGIAKNMQDSDSSP
ncbi:hypothetical protein CAPTEDRAFT_206203 [Capitella teleta]|uniref:THAP-type domain-containing protein n=1 Tax=Capitella teleta TaxID=283909 RepID=R7U5E9_CAPTE|nr:hypothetical protein CAPTEDRAFT_206203 [Capitella teleta]|eukprot:ELU01595.1 hypothetical protein CAPTEDRAFT_206203 [Capitella teleta]